MGKSIYFTSDELEYLWRLANSHDSWDAEDLGDYKEAKIIPKVAFKVSEAIQKDKATKKTT